MKWLARHLLRLAALCMMTAAPALAHHPDTTWIEAADLLDLMSSPGLVILDVRLMSDYEESSLRIKGAERTNMTRLREWVKSKPGGSTVVVYCNSENDSHSTSVAFKLQELGMKRVYYLRGGWERWLEAGFPVEKK